MCVNQSALKWAKLVVTAALFLSGWNTQVQAAAVVTNIANLGMSTRPSGEMIQTSDGYWWGPQSFGIAAQPPLLGGIFRMAADGSLTEYPADTPDASPDYLLLGADDSFYGVSACGVQRSSTNFDNYGSVFRFFTNGTFTNLATFGGTNGSEPVCLVRTDDGSLYGTTMFGGIGFTNNPLSGYGTIFKLDTNGILTTLLYFSGTNGGNPNYLALGGDGNIYGVALTGGIDTNVVFPYGVGIVTTGNGTMFEIHRDGSVEVKASFTVSNNVGTTVTALVAGRDGNIYGTAGNSGAYGHGTIFEFCRNGILQPVAAFDGTNGAFPGSLLQSSDGAFYGAAHGNGDTPYPNIFRWSPAQGITSLYSLTFDSPDGPYPLTGLAQGNTGLFYGMENGSALGMVLQFSLPLPPVVQSSIPSSASGVTLSWNTVPWQTYQAQYCTNLGGTNWINLGGSFTATNSSFSISNASGADLQRFYRVVLSP